MGWMNLQRMQGMVFFMKDSDLEPERLNLQSQR